MEHLFGIGPSSAQSLMKAVGDVQTVGGTHFIERATLVSFLDEMITSTSIEEALRTRMLKQTAATAEAVARGAAL